MQDNHELMEFTEGLTDAGITWAIRYLDPESCAGKSPRTSRHACRDLHQLARRINKRNNLHLRLHAEPVNLQSAREPASGFAEMKLEHLLMQENSEPKRHPENRDKVGNSLPRSICICGEDHAVTVVKTLVGLLVLVAGILLYIISVSLLISVLHIWWRHLQTS